MRYFACLLQLILYCTVFGYAHANPLQSVVILTDDSEEVRLGPYLSILEDPQGQLTFEDVLQPKYASQFQPNQKNVPVFSLTDATYWLQFNVRNNTSDLSEWLLEQRFIATHYLDLFQPLPDGQGYLLKKSGFLRSYSDRDIPRRQILFNLSIPPNSEQTLYLRMQSIGYTTIDLRLWTATAFALAAQSNAFWLGLFYGVLLVMLAYTSFLYLSLRDSCFLYLMIFIATISSAFIFYDGFFQAIFGPKFIPIKLYAIPLLVGASMIALLRFAQRYLNTAQYLKRLHPLLNNLVILWMILLSSVPFIPQYADELMIPALVVTVISVALSGVQNWLQKKSSARFFLTSWLMFLIAFAVFALTRIGWLESNVITEQSLRVALIWLVLFKSLALGDRINRLKRKAQQANLALQESEARHQAFITTSNNGIWRATLEPPVPINTPKKKQVKLIKANFRFAECNDAFAKMHGLTSAKQIPKRPKNLLLTETSLDFLVNRYLSRNYSLDSTIFHPRYDSNVWLDTSVVSQIEQNSLVQLWGITRDITLLKHNEDAIHNIAAGVSCQTGDAFFQQLVLHLAKLFSAEYAFIGQIEEKTPNTLTTIALCAQGNINDNFSYSIEGTPCANVMNQTTCSYPNNVQKLFPKDVLLVELGAESYIGTPLLDSKRNPIGLIAVLDTKPMTRSQQITEILQIFAARAAAEMERVKADEAVRKLSRAVEQSPNMIMITDVQGKIEYVNPAFTRTTGYLASDAIGKFPSLLKSEHTPEIVYEDMWAVLNKGQIWSGELYNRKKDGSFYWDFASISPIKDDNQNVTHYLAIQSDITEQKHMVAQLQQHQEQLEELVQQRTAELQAVNKELNAFSHSVSHDLRAPLRAIDGFSNALLEDYYDDMDENARNFLNRIRSNTKRMSELIKDLLRLSRLGHQNLNIQPLRLDHISQEIMDNLLATQPDRQIDYRCHITKTVHGDVKLLQIVMENLLANALKFSRYQLKPDIHVGEINTANERVYYVKDNGVGFDMRYIDKLFGTFQRLHSEEQFEGTGIGLATVRRIIHQHGGRIWAKSEPNQGASFYFTLARHETTHNKKSA